MVREQNFWLHPSMAQAKQLLVEMYQRGEKYSEMAKAISTMGIVQNDGTPLPSQTVGVILRREGVVFNRRPGLKRRKKSKKARRGAAMPVKPQKSPLMDTLSAIMSSNMPDALKIEVIQKLASQG